MTQEPATLALQPVPAFPPSRIAAAAGILLPGIALAALIALLAAALRQLPGFNLLSPLILALGLGMLIGNLLPLSPRLRPGMTFALRHLLRIGVVLLGLQLTFAQLVAVGPGGMALILTVLGASFGTTLLLGRWLGVDPGLTRLIATGTAICGAAAVAAANGVVRARDEHVAYALASVTIFGSLSMLLYPTLGAALGLAPHAYGLWTGAVLVVTVNSTGLIPAAATQPLVASTPWLLAAALGALGLEARLDRLRSQGLRPLLVGAGAWLFISGFSLALIALSEP